jgi:hypothetical protein
VSLIDFKEYMMKLLDIKKPAYIIATLTALLLSGCGTTGTPSDTQLVENSTIKQAPYVIDAYQGTTAVVHSHVDPAIVGTHQWTQLSGSTVTIATPTSQTTTIPVPTTTITPIVLQHTHTNTQTGVVTNTQHTVAPLPSTQALGITVSNPISVVQGTKASLHVSASGGYPPYTYVWQQTQGTSATLDETHPSAPTFIVPISTAADPHQNETLIFTVRVLDSNGGDVSTAESIISVSPFILIDTPIPLKEVDNSTFQPGHSVGRGPMVITNAFAGETYSWRIQEISGATPALINLEISPRPDTLSANIRFNSPDVNVTTTYDLKITAKSSHRLGFIDTQITINP